MGLEYRWWDWSTPAQGGEGFVPLRALLLFNRLKLITASEGAQRAARVPFLCLFVCLLVRLFVCFFASSFVCLFNNCLFVSLLVCLFVCLFVCPVVCLLAYLLFICLFVRF